MAKKEENDNSALIGIGAFLIGAALAQPSKENAQKLNQLKSNEYLFNQFQLNYHDFQSYLNERTIKNKRWESLGELKINQRIANHPEIQNFFNEAVNMFFEGFFRGACISCAIVMEALLKENFGDKRFVDLIDEAKDANMLSNSEKHYLHGIRLDRNDFVHTINHEAGENDAKVVILITSKIINKIV